MKYLHYVVKLLLIIGALNWGLVGFFKFDLVGAIFGGTYAPMSRLIFAIVGLAGIYSLFCLCKCCCGGVCSCHHKGQGQGPQQM